MKWGLIVEGQGDELAAPVVLRRIASYFAPTRPLGAFEPLRVSRGKLVKELEGKRAVELVARRVGPGGPLVIVFDADDDCPATLAPKVLAWAREARADRPIAVVLAEREFEAWFLGAATSLRGVRGLPDDLEPPPSPEGVSGAKEWLDRHMPEGYGETLEQIELARRFDLEQARAACPSFDKLVRDVLRLLGA
ncbi:MAG TPA: DUF4276 family protein [Polyangiaceae bacterium]|nr:DUF4276 family protein [Polyangiaceae bacterium]